MEGATARRTRRVVDGQSGRHRRVGRLLDWTGTRLGAPVKSDLELIAEMQGALIRDGACPMSLMFRWLDLPSCLDHPDVLADARFTYDEELRDEWGPEWLSAGAECNVFIPAELVPFCV